MRRGSSHGVKLVPAVICDLLYIVLVIDVELVSWFTDFYDVVDVDCDHDAVADSVVYQLTLESLGVQSIHTDRPSYSSTHFIFSYAFKTNKFSILLSKPGNPGFCSISQIN